MRKMNGLDVSKVDLSITDTRYGVIITLDVGAHSSADIADLVSGSYAVVVDMYKR